MRIGKRGAGHLGPDERQSGGRSAGILPANVCHAIARKNAGPSKIRVNKMPALRMQSCRSYN